MMLTGSKSVTLSWDLQLIRTIGSGWLDLGSLPPVGFQQIQSHCDGTDLNRVLHGDCFRHGLDMLEFKFHS